MEAFWEILRKKITSLAFWHLLAAADEELVAIIIVGRSRSLSVLWNNVIMAPKTALKCDAEFHPVAGINNHYDFMERWCLIG